MLREDNWRSRRDLLKIQIIQEAGKGVWSIWHCFRDVFGDKKRVKEHSKVMLKESKLEAISIIQRVLCSGLEVREVKRIDGY